MTAVLPACSRSAGWRWRAAAPCSSTAQPCSATKCRQAWTSVRVEVLRGPQSVYFGRSTETGAVSYRTKPIPDHWTGVAEIEVGQRNLHNQSASVAGPLLPGVLGGRLTVLSEDTDGYVANNYNNGSGKLGQQSRRSASGTLEFTPTVDLSFKGYFNVFSDDDGPSATAFVPASLDNCKLGTTQTTFCGQIPSRSNSINYINTTIPTAMSNNIFQSALIGGTGFQKKVGQQRVAYSNDIATTWDISDYLHLQAITGYHTNTTMAVADGIGQPVQSTFPYSSYFYTLTQKFRDFSQEVRLSSSPEERFSWTIGTNYIRTVSYLQAITDFLTQPAGVPDQFAAIARRPDRGYHRGIRWRVLQGDAGADGQRRGARATRPAPCQGLCRHHRRHGLGPRQEVHVVQPRVSADYDVGGGRKVYASYATGTRPGGFNTNIAAQANNPVALAQIAQILGGGASTAFLEEKLKVAELGFKGEFDGGKGFFDINAYAGKLVNQQLSIGALIPVLGYSVTGTTNGGESKIHGIEFQGDYSLTREFSVSTTFAWNYTKRTKYQNTAGIPEFGTTDFSGKKFANVPEYSGSVIGSYIRPMADKWNFFSNIAETYRGKEYVDAFNAAYIGGRFQTDLHVGVANDRYSIEGYVKNVFNDQKYTGGNVAPDYGTGSYNAFFGGWAPPRQIGARLRASF